MLAFFRTVAVFAVLLSLLRLLLPGGAGKRAAELAFGAALAVVLLSPLRDLTAEDVRGYLSSFFPAAEAAPSAELQKSILSEQTAAYIESRADGLGCPCRAEVTLLPAEGGFLVDSVRLYAESPPPEALTEAISRELGCAKERISCSFG